jgi:hypothetical protein
MSGQKRTKSVIMAAKTKTANKLSHTVYTDKYPKLETMIRRASREGVCFSRFAANALELAYISAGYGDAKDSAAK